MNAGGSIKLLIRATWQVKVLARHGDMGTGRYHTNWSCMITISGPYFSLDGFGRNACTIVISDAVQFASLNIPRGMQELYLHYHCQPACQKWVFMLWKHDFQQHEGVEVERRAPDSVAPGLAVVTILIMSEMSREHS